MRIQADRGGFLPPSASIRPLSCVPESLVWGSRPCQCGKRWGEETCLPGQLCVVHAPPDTLLRRPPNPTSSPSCCSFPLAELQPPKDISTLAPGICKVPPHDTDLSDLLRRLPRITWMGPRGGHKCVLLREAHSGAAMEKRSRESCSGQPGRPG